MMSASLPCSVKRGARLVEEPQGTLHSKQAGEREPPPLSRREVACRQMREGVEPYTRERGRDLSATSEKIAPEDEVLLDRERWFEGILVADIVGLFSYGEFRVAAVENEPALAWADEPGHDAEKG
jgi:hypothetical protein